MSPLRILLVLVLALLSLELSVPSLQAAEPTSGCHCFKDRTYNPLNKSASDEYILATSFNSLLSKYFDISKRQVVMLKMKSAIKQDDLIIGLSLAKLSRIPFDEILALHKTNLSWEKVVKSRALAKLKITPAVQLLIDDKSSKAATMFSNDIIATFFNFSSSTIKGLRVYNFTEKEIALISILEVSTNLTEQEIITLRIDEGKSWSEIAYSQGVEPADAGKRILNYSPAN